MNDLKFSLSRTIVICAERSLVFRFFTDSKLFADWWGAGSEIEGQPGGALKIRYPEGTLASGKVVEISTDERIVFTYGYDSGVPIPSGSSLVTVTLRDHPDGTEVTLKHDLADASIRDAHIGGWGYQLSVFANVAAREQHKNIERSIDEYFELWSNPDADARLSTLQRIAVPEITFRDAYGCIAGLEDFNRHIAAVQQHMSGITLSREGSAHQCQGTVIASWIARKKDGSEAGHGKNVFDLKGDGRLKRIVGFWLKD